MTKEEIGKDVQIYGITGLSRDESRKPEHCRT